MNIPYTCGFVFQNDIDPRYKFVLDIREAIPEYGCSINQIGPTPNGRVYYNGIFSQLTQARTTKERIIRLANRLISANPTTKWFQRKVCWVYK